MKKNHLTILSGAILTLVLVGAGCKSSVTTNDYKTATPQQTTPVVVNVELKEFTVTAKNWKFDPGTMTVNKGDKVRLTITSTDVAHSFMLKDYNLNVKLEPNKTQVVEFIADKAGSFTFKCAIPCGDGHREMNGTLIVK